MNKELTMKRGERMFLSNVIRVPHEGSSKTWELRAYMSTNHCLQHEEMAWLISFFKLRLTKYELFQ